MIIAIDQLAGKEAINLQMPKRTAVQPEAKQAVCVQAGLLVMSVANKLLVRIDTIVSKLTAGHKQSEMNKLKVQNSLLKLMAEMLLVTALNSDSNCILYKPLSDPEWIKLKPYCIIDVSNSSI